MELINIPFNKPYLTGKEAHYMYQSVYSGKISGNGKFTQLCHNYFVNRYNFLKVLLTTSCTDALEMASLLTDIQSKDEVIVPSFTFVSTANAFLLRGAEIVFGDSEMYIPNIDPDSIEELITPKTKAIVVVHYAGVACNMSKIMDLAKKYNLYVIEDAAQAIDSYYNGKPLGSIGDFGAFSFHETKNIMSGEGGMLVVNNDKFVKRSEIIWEKGTNRSAFFKGEIDKYGWVDIGSSYLPSELISSFLFAQLENLEDIQNRRKKIWDLYYTALKPMELKGNILLPIIPEYATNNAHMFYIICDSEAVRTNLINYLRSKGVLAVFHYLSLHDSPYFSEKYKGKLLVNSNKYSNTLLRLPLYYELSEIQVEYIVDCINQFFC